MAKSSNGNVRMVITEEKILANIEKVKKMINPNSKKRIVKLEEDSYFLDLIASSCIILSCISSSTAWIISFPHIV